MTTLNLIESRTERRHDLHQRRQQPRRAERDVITGSQFRRKLGWGKDRFRAAVQSGRFTHLISLHASSPTRVVYVRAKVEAWLSESPVLRPLGHNRRG